MRASGWRRGEVGQGALSAQAEPRNLPATWFAGNYHDPAIVAARQASALATRLPPNQFRRRPSGSIADLNTVARQPLAV
jgi:hypothetical protein